MIILLVTHYEDILIMRLVEQNQQLMQALISNGMTVPQNVTNITNNNNITNNVQNNLYLNVTICCFGTEDLTKLDTEKVLNLVRNHSQDFIPKMIEYVHANPEMPEYHNVFFDKNRGKAIVFGPISDEKQSWQAKDIKEISDQLTDKIQKHMDPREGPYFNLAMQSKDSNASNNIIKIAHHVDWKTPEILEQNKESLSKLAKNRQFVELVKDV